MFTTTHKRGNIFRRGFHVVCVRQLTSDDAATKKHRCNTYDDVESSFASCGLELFRHELVVGDLGIDGSYGGLDDDFKAGFEGF
jgi:hypothetical protein